ncbi:MAG: hypothetical protein ABJO72_02675 [Hyphomicrobiales bacterium]
MITNTFINSLLKSGSVLSHQASLKWWHIGGGIVGFFLLLLIGLEFIVAQDTAEMMLRDRSSGKLPEGAGLKTAIIALLFCGTMLAVFHKPTGRLRNSLTGRILFWVLISACAVTLSQPLISLLSELRFGNSLSGGEDAALLLKQKLVAFGYGVRAFVILGAAFAASWGMHKIFDAVRKVADANRDGKDSAEIYEGVNDTDQLHQKAVTSRERAMSFNWNGSESFSVAVAEGYSEMANTIARYLKGPDDPFVDPEQVIQDVIAQFEEPIAPPEDPNVARMVMTRLKKHSIDISLLPSSSAQLTKAARKQLAHYADWLRAHADVDAIHQSTRYEMVTPNA